MPTLRNGLLSILAAMLLSGCGGDRSPGREDAAGKTPPASGAGPAAPETAGAVAAAGPSGARSDTTKAKLGPGMPFPSVPLRTMEDEPVDSRALVAGRPSLVLLIDADCEACREFLDVWKARRAELPAGLNVLGIAREPVDYARDYARNNGFPFPLYSDEEDVFADTYVIRVSPSVVGTYEDGVIAYIGKAVTPEFTPRKAVELLEQLRRGREAGEHPAGG